MGGQGVANWFIMSYWLQDWTWQVSWVQGARWRWVSLDLRDLSMLSRTLSYRNSITIMGDTLGPAPWIPCPFVETPWWVGSRVTELQTINMASSSVINSSSTSMLQDAENENERLGCHYDRWFVVQSVDTGHPVSKLSPFIQLKIHQSQPNIYTLY